ncbi:MAG: hypothetical protein QOF19_1935 [Alphaproteobacteria bacterium]|jgi:hypothetical protein|nr:hypothetical protein [Alphaproteobacteria bacterium]
MSTKYQAPHKSGLPMAERRNLAVLESSAGTFGRLRVGRLARKEAERSLTNVTIAKNQTLERVVTAELAAIEVAVVGAIMGQGQRVAATLAEDIASETGAAQTRLTTLAGAERITHVQNRTEAYSAIRTRVQSNAVSDSEADALRSYADADLTADVERTNARINRSKDFVEQLHGDTLDALRRASEHLR